MKRWGFGPIFLVLLCSVSAGSASASTLCVNAAGHFGCYKTISAAVAAASPNDLIQVTPGVYKEDVVIGEPLTLVAAIPATAIVDATGLSNGFYIDGFDHHGLNAVTVSGFVVKNATNEGILISNASMVTVSGNYLTGNDVGLGSGCPGIQPFELDEAFDCGEGIHLSAVDHSTIANNRVEGNAGGILISDDSGPTFNNVIEGNSVIGNPFDCGITLASHPSSAYTAGITHNTISGNISDHNGYQEPGAGAGVGIFSAGPGGEVSGNVIIGNTLTRNGLPGVAFHSHDPFDNLNDNVIAGNKIWGNGADTADALTPGTTGINVFGASPITGTIVTENVITGQDDDIVVKTTGHVEAHYNQLLGRKTGLANVNANGSGFGTVNATLNWWGCPAGPGAPHCSAVSGPDIVVSPVLFVPF
ncbi:MAG: right-handed parallel beta-helix repeat-containing protein [Candidatus Acidiferrales bacterium]